MSYRHSHRSNVPVSIGMICMLIYAVPVLIRLKHTSPDFDVTKVKWICGTAIGIFAIGTLGGTVLDMKYLRKKLTDEQLLRLDALIAAIWLLLMVIVGIGGLLLLTGSMDWM